MVGKNNLDYGLLFCRQKYGVVFTLDEQGAAGRHDNWSCWQF